MAFKSESQRRKFAQYVRDGKMSQKVYDEWSKDSPAQLPERLGKPQKPSLKKRFGL